MDYKAVLLADLGKGFTKSKLEELIGLPKNNLSGFLKGDRKLSKISMLKIEKWEASEKPDPLKIVSYKKEVKEVSNVIDEKGISYGIKTWENSKYDFGDDKFLMIEKYTKYPQKSKPANKYDVGKWQTIKNESDKGIREAWNKHK